MVEKLVPNLFLKLSISLDQQPEILCNLGFFVCLSRELPKHNEANLLMTCFYLIRIFFKKQKKSGTSLHVLFTARVFKKNIYHVTFFQLT